MLERDFIPEQFANLLGQMAHSSPKLSSALAPIAHAVPAVITLVYRRRPEPFQSYAAVTSLSYAAVTSLSLRCCHLSCLMLLSPSVLADVLRFDNTYSLLHTKKVGYTAEVLLPDKACEEKLQGLGSVSPP